MWNVMQRVLLGVMAMKKLIAGDAAYLSLPQGEAYSGLSQMTIRRLAKKGLLTLYRPVPGRTLLNKEELEKYLRESAVPPATE
jgi:excisionase family DNA binding protein